MHILTIDRQDDTVIQGALRVEFAKKTDRSVRIWGHMRVALRGFAGLPALSRFLSVQSHPDGPVCLTLGAVCETQHEDALRHSLAGFFRLDGHGDVKVSSPGSAEDFGEAFLDPEAERWSIHTDVTTGDGSARLLLPINLFTLLGQNLARADQLGAAFRYECALAPGRPDPEVMRKARYAATALKAQGAPDAIAEDQVARSEALANATAHVVEALVAPPNLLRVVEEEAQRAVSGHPLGASGYVPKLEPADDLEAEALGYLTHPGILEPGADMDANGFLDEPARLARVLLDPLAQHLGVPDPDAAEAFGPIASPPKTQAPDMQGEPFLFLSYARDDWDRVEPLVLTLREKGIRIWTDAQIQPAQEWDTALEEKVRVAAGIFCVVTDSFVQSKYCRREIKFADALDKPILAALEESATLSDGLAMIFASCQYVPMDHDLVVDKLYGAAKVMMQEGAHE